MGHDQFDILVLESGSIDLLSIVLIIVLLVLAGIDSLALSVVVGVIMARVVVSSVVVGFSGGELLGSRCLSLGVQVLNLGLTEDAVKNISRSLRVMLSVDLHVGVG